MRNVILFFSITVALIIGVEIGEKVTSAAYEHVIADIRKAHDNGMVSRQELKALRRFAAILWREARLDPEAVGDLDKPNFSYGPCQFQQRTFDEFKMQAGMPWLEWTDPEHQIILTWWAVKNGKARAWSVIKNSTEF